MNNNIHFITCYNVYSDFQLLRSISQWHFIIIPYIVEKKENGCLNMITEIYQGSEEFVTIGSKTELFCLKLRSIPLLLYWKSWMCCGYSLRALFYITSLALPSGTRKYKMNSMGKGFWSLEWKYPGKHLLFKV